MTPRGVCFSRPAPFVAWKSAEREIAHYQPEFGIPFDRSAHRPSLIQRKRASFALPSKPALRLVQLDSPIIGARELISIYTY